MLPINEFLPQINQSLANGNNLVLQAEPGAGKSTALPLSLLDAQWLKGKKILMLEPRRIAAKSIAHYLSSQLGEPVGQRVGYQIKNERKISQNTVLEIITEGILTRRLQNDPEISDIGLILFDEFHERSIHSDLSLMLALEIQQSIREDLQLVVMSATIDTQMISAYIGNADVIQCPGRCFPVEVKYRPSSKNPLVSQVMSALNSILSEDQSIQSQTVDNQGDTLVFLPGQGEINRCLRAAKDRFGSDDSILFLPLHGGLSLSQQEKALVPDPNGKRRVVFTTNIAETSLTIECVSCVIDCGLEKVLVYDPASAMTRLDTTYISKASAEQRKGRAGRTQAGICFRLWDEQTQRSLRDYQGEEICSADLSGLILELCVWGAGSYKEINWLTPPPEPHYQSARTLLITLGLINSEDKATPLGLNASGLGLSPRLSSLLLKAEGKIEREIACDLAALLGERDIFLPKNGTDITARLLALQQYRNNRRTALTQYPLNPSTVARVNTDVQSIKRRLKMGKSVAEISLSQVQEIVGKLLLHAYPDRLGKKRHNSINRYHLANGRGVFLFDDDPLCGNGWLIITDCDAQKKEGRIYTAASIDKETLLNGIADQLDEEDVYGYDTKKQKITGRRVTTYGTMEIKSQTIATIPPDKFQQCLITIIKDHGLEILNWTSHCHEWLARVRWLGRYEETFAPFSEKALLETIEDWLIPYISHTKSITDIQRIDVLELLISTLSWDDQQILEKEAPIKYQTPSGKNVPIIYDSQQGPTVSVPLQEMFGETTSPLIAGGRVTIRFELLSPARRPIQTTSDLSNFWKTSYFEVAKEMRGRYPKHRWPEQPLLEKPGKSIKRR